MFKFFQRKKKARNSRQSKRIRLAYLVKYQVGDDRQPRIANILDISGGGLRFWTLERIPESSLLNVSVYLPPLGRSVEATAQVLRVRRTKKKLLYYVAVRFLELSEKDHNAINEFAETLDKDKDARLLIDHADIVVRVQ